MEKQNRKHNAKTDVNGELPSDKKYSREQVLELLKILRLRLGLYGMYTESDCNDWIALYMKE